MHVEARLEEGAIGAAVVFGIEDVEGALLHARARVGALVEGDFARGLDDSIHARGGDLVLAKLAAEMSCKSMYLQGAAATRGQGLIDFVLTSTLTLTKQVLVHLAWQANFQWWNSHF